jgi:hypothetical protein
MKYTIRAYLNTELELEVDAEDQAQAESIAKSIPASCWVVLNDESLTISDIHCHKYTIKECSGYWVDDPLRIITGVRVALEAWDCEEDHEDESVFFYMDNEPLRVGSFIAEGFVVTEIEGGSDE